MDDCGCYPGIRRDLGFWAWQGKAGVCGLKLRRPWLGDTDSGFRVRVLGVRIIEAPNLTP